MVLWKAHGVVGGVGGLSTVPCAQFYAVVVMRQGRGNEATEVVFCLQAKRPLHSGSYEHRVPKIQTKHFSVCLIQHRNWPLTSTILNAHGTNASPEGLCTRAHTNEAFSCWFCCNSFRVDGARRGNVCSSSQGMLSDRPACPEI